MKKKFTNRKEFQRLLTETGIKDVTLIQEKIERGTGKKRNELVNVQRRTVRAMLQLSNEEQLKALDLLRREVSQRVVDNSELENG